LSNLEFSFTGLNTLKVLEGFKAKPYPDSGGKMTVGYGHLIVKGDGVSTGDIIDQVKATELLVRDVQKAVDCVNGCVTSTINQNQFDALVVFAYNVGSHALQNSTLLRKLNFKDFQEASNQFLVWDKVRANGMFIEVNGLKNRRLAEQKLFNTPVGVQDGT